MAAADSDADARAAASLAVVADAVALSASALAALAEPAAAAADSPAADTDARASSNHAPTSRRNSSKASRSRSPADSAARIHASRLAVPDSGTISSTDSPGRPLDTATSTHAPGSSSRSTLPSNTGLRSFVVISQPPGTGRDTFERTHTSVTASAIPVMIFKSPVTRVISLTPKTP